MSALDLVLPEAPPQSVPFSVRLAERTVRLAGGHERPSNRRAYERRRAQDLDWLRAVRLTGGTAYGVTLIDLSEGGALIEVDAPLRPGVKMTLELSGRGLDATVPLEVVRSYVASLRGGSTLYRGACVFAHVIDLPGPESAPLQGPPSSPFVGTDAALTYLFDRCSARTERGGDFGANTVLDRRELLKVLESLHSRGSTIRHDAVGRNRLELLGAVLPALQRGASRQDAVSALECRFRTLPREMQSELQSTSARIAALIDHCLPVACTLDGDDHATREVASAAPVPSDRSDTAFQKIVVRFADGSLMKGFTQDFHPSRGQFSLWPAINARPSERTIVPVERLKAVFFVRNFNGNPGYRERKSFTVRGQGRRVEVTFADTEVIVGTTLNYRPDGLGFFVSPADPAANNTRVFVVGSAVRRVRFL
jgi:hypothetical protein